jgi:hypothetical protein
MRGFYFSTSDRFHHPSINSFATHSQLAFGKDTAAMNLSSRAPFGAFFAINGGEGPALKILGHITFQSHTKCHPDRREGSAVVFFVTLGGTYLSPRDNDGRIDLRLFFAFALGQV